MIDMAIPNGVHLAWTHGEPQCLESGAPLLYPWRERAKPLKGRVVRCRIVWAVEVSDKKNNKNKTHRGLIRPPHVSHQQPTKNMQAQRRRYRRRGLTRGVVGEAQYHRFGDDQFGRG